MFKPKVFVSSTVYDFADLRSGLKFYLEELGFEVRLSDYNDFSIPFNTDVFTACLESLKECEYYILLIGDRKGSAFPSQPEKSITQIEYEAAYQLAQSGIIRPVYFIRKSTQKACDVYSELLAKAPTECVPFLEEVRIKELDIKFATDFINLVKRETESELARKGLGPVPKSNWIYHFDTFRDIVEALKVAFKVEKGLRKKALEALLRGELEQLIASFFVNTLKAKKTVYYSHRLRFFMKKYPILEDDNWKGTINVPVDDLREISIYLNGVARSPHQGLMLRHLETAITSTEFLQFNLATQDYESTPMQQFMEFIVNGMNRIRNVEVLLNPVKEEYFRICASKTTQNVEIEKYHLVGIFNQAIFEDMLGYIIGAVIKYLKDGSVDLAKLVPVPDPFIYPEKLEDLISDGLYLVPPTPAEILDSLEFPRIEKSAGTLP